MIVPELHDLGKLAAECLRGQQHSFHRSGKFVPGIPIPSLIERDLTWASVMYHMGLAGWSEWVRDLSLPAPHDWIGPEERKALFLVCLADRLAATTVRAVHERPETKEWKDLWSERALVLWRNEPSHGDPEPIKTPADLEELFTLWENSSASAVFERLAGNFRARGEDEAWPNQVTSLWAHCTLTGQYYRALEKHVEVRTSHEGFCLALDGAEVRNLKDASNRWKFRIARVTVKFHQSFARAMDVAVLRDLRDALYDFESPYLLFRTGTTLYLFLPSSTLNLRDVLKPLTDRGFYAEAHTREAPSSSLQLWRSPRSGDIHRELIRAASAKLERRRDHIKAVLKHPGTPAERKREVGPEVGRLEAKLRALRELESDGPVPRASVTPESCRSFYPPEVESTVEIEPPLCDVCQVRRGIPRRVATVTENLCNRCWELRDRGFRQADLRQWEERDSLACWICASLDPRRAELLVEALYGKRVIDGVLCVGTVPRDNETPMPMLSQFRPLGILRDMHDEFTQMIKEFGDAARRIFRDIVELTDGVWIAELAEKRQLLQLLRSYVDLMKQHFPVLLEQRWRSGLLAEAAKAVRLGVSYGPAKWPFYVYWRHVSDPSHAVAVRGTRSFKFEVDLPGLQALITGMGDWMDDRPSLVRRYLHELAGVERRTGLPELAWAVVKADSKEPGPIQATAREVVSRFDDGIRKGLFGSVQVLALLELTFGGESSRVRGGGDPYRVHR